MSHIKFTNEPTGPQMELPVSPYFGELLPNGGIPLQYSPMGEPIIEITRFFYNDTTDQLIQYALLGGVYNYIDPQSNVVAKPTIPPFYEITMKDYLEKRKQISNKKDEVPFNIKAAIEAWFLPIFEPDMGYEQNDLKDMIKLHFANQIDFNGKLIPTMTANQTATYIADEKKKLEKQQKESDEITSLNTSINLINNPILNHIYIVFNFLRSYVDLYHDILIQGSVICEPIRQHFETHMLQSLQDLAKSAYMYYMTQIWKGANKIFRISGHINQTNCGIILEELTDKFIELLHQAGIKWIPKTSQESFIKTTILASKENPLKATLNNAAVKDLIKELNRNAVNGFYVESAMSDIGQLLTDNGFPRADIEIGKWDAGSGFSKGPLSVSIGPLPRANAPTNLTLDNQIIRLFNIYDIVISPDNKNLDINVNGITIASISGGPKLLSVNSLLTAANLNPVRGDSPGSKLGIEIAGGAALSQQTQCGIVSLKTWTDLIQIVTLSESKKIKEGGVGPNLKIAVVISDALCEITARMYGIGHVIKNTKGILTYNCYDNNARSLDPKEVNIRLELKASIMTNIGPDGILTSYINRWFDQRINYLNWVSTITIDPSIYFTSYLYKDIYSKNKENALKELNNIANVDLKNLPSTLNVYIESITQASSTLGSLLEQMDMFDKALSNINELRSRVEKDNYLTAYNAIQTEICRTFKDTDAQELRILVATTIASAIMKKNGPDRFFVSLNSIKQEMINDVSVNISIDKKQINDNIGSGNRYRNKDYIKGYTTRIKNIYTYLIRPDINRVELANDILNICDVELALLELLKLQVRGKQNAQNAVDRVITYEKYVKRISSSIGFPLRAAIPQFSFNSIRIEVGARIKGYINASVYSGGRNKRKYYKKRTIKHKKGLKKIHKKHKTMKKRHN